MRCLIVSMNRIKSMIKISPVMTFTIIEETRTNLTSHDRQSAVDGVLVLDESRR